MDPESLQIDFEWACDLEQPHGRFNFGDSCLILDELNRPGLIGGSNS